MECIISFIKVDPAVIKQCDVLRGGREWKIDIFYSLAIVPVRNFRRATVASSLFTCAYAISFHSRHDSPVPSNRVRQILNRKSIIAQLDLNSCNSTVIGGTSVNLDQVHTAEALLYNIFALSSRRHTSRNSRSSSHRGPPLM